NVYSSIKSEILTILAQMQARGELPAELALDAIDVMPTREASHGDMATNAAMVLAAKASKKPKELAEQLIQYIQKISHVETVELAGPGFINMRFAPTFWHAVIPAIIKSGKGYGNSDIGQNRKINVEYVSANPTGPIHVGHARGAVYGDALALLLMKVGF